MRYSPEALTAFVEAVACGSFSAAARRLRKSQSTISTAIANLEADLGLTLFDRQARQPVLTEAGRKRVSERLSPQAWFTTLPDGVQRAAHQSSVPVRCATA